MTKFEWDPDKAKSNIRDHRVSFEEAKTVFLLDELSATTADSDHSDRENRFITVGLSAKGRLLTICHTERGEFIRIIGARPVTRQEREIYEEHQARPR